ncbi:MAG: helix-turn-helix transcriptional regulator [Nannocystaceae bacterium]
MKERIATVLAESGFGPIGFRARRRRLLDALVQDFRASFGLSWVFLDARGGCSPAETVAVGVGDAAFLRLAAAEGRAMCVGFGDTELGADAGEVTTVGSFGLLERQTLKHVPVLRELSAVSGAHHCLRIHVACGDTSAGWYGAFRSVSQPRFSSRDLRAARQLQDEFSRSVCSSASASGREQLDGDVVVVTTAAGEVLNHSAGAERWLSAPGVAAGLADRVRAFLRHGEAQRSCLFSRTWLHLDRLDARGEHVVVMAKPAPFARISPLSGLTKAQRRVAVLGAGGASINEMASALSRSRETVREHLAAVYRRLGVRRRVDLAQRLGQVPRMEVGV